METNLPNSNNFSQPVPPSQTGSPQNPIQVENVQYNVQVGKFFSRVGFAFMVANVSLVILGFFLADALYGITGQIFGFEKDVVAERLILLISFAVPLLPLHIFSASRLKKLIENPVNIEDITFKKILRRSLWIEVIIAVLLISGGIYDGLSAMFLTGEGNNVVFAAFSSAIFYGGTFALLAWWSYSFQRLTQR